MKQISASRLHLLLIPCAALIACWKLLASGPSCGHDFDFHLLSWMEAARDWKEGVLYPHWLSSANYGAGEPRFVFYPPLSWMLGAALGSVAGWNLAPLLYTALALLGCGASMYLLAREWLPPDVSARAAALYMLSPYTGFVAYERAAYGELLAAAFVPLVLLFALRRRPATVPLAISIAAVWLSNAPAGVMAGYMLAFVAVTVAIVERRLQPAFRAAGGASLGLGLAAFYLVPAAFERRWVQIERAVGPGMRIEDSFLFGHTGEPYHDQVLRTASWVAVFMFAVSAAAAVGFFVRRSNPLENHYRHARSLWIPLFALLPLCLFLLFPLSRTLWTHAPELAFLQFPWRWLLVEGVAYALLAAAVLSGRAVLSGTLLFLLLLGAVEQKNFYQACDEEDAVAAQIMDFQTGAGVEGTDEYVSLHADNGAVQKSLPDVRVVASPHDDEVDSSVSENPQWAAAGTVPTAEVAIEHWSGEYRLVRIHTREAGFAVMRMMDYPAWEVRVNGIDISARPQRDDGLLTVPVAAGAARIEMTWHTTGDAWVGRSISLFALLSIVGIAWKRHRANAAGAVEKVS